MAAREVAKFIPPDTIEIVKQLNPESLDGILDWSHCWLVTMGADGFGLVLFEIVGIENQRRLKLIGKFEELNGKKIVDIKPVHPCDLARDSF
jgi:tRNA (Thr-GGU) A37 N-methylase